MRTSVYISLLSILLFGTYSKNKMPTDVKNKSGSKALSRLTSAPGVDIYNGIARYESIQVFQTVYDQLSADYMENLQSIEEDYYAENLTDEQYQDLAWIVWDKTQEPLV